MSTCLWLCYARWRIGFRFWRTICLDLKREPCHVFPLFMCIYLFSFQASKDIIRAALHAALLYTVD